MHLQSIGSWPIWLEDQARPTEPGLPSFAHPLPPGVAEPRRSLSVLDAGPWRYNPAPPHDLPARPSLSLLCPAVDRTDDLAPGRQPVPNRPVVVGPRGDRIGDGDEHGARRQLPADGAVPAGRRSCRRPPAPLPRPVRLGCPQWIRRRRRGAPGGDRATRGLARLHRRSPVRPGGSLLLSRPTPPPCRRSCPPSRSPAPTRSPG